MDPAETDQGCIPGILFGYPSTFKVAVVGQPASQPPFLILHTYASREYIRKKSLELKGSTIFFSLQKRNIEYQAPNLCLYFGGKSSIRLGFFLIKCSMAIETQINFFDEL